jgi:hypothetical protein
MTELNISNIATASEMFTKPVQPVLKHQLFISVNVIDENVHHFLSVFSVFVRFSLRTAPWKAFVVHLSSAHTNYRWRFQCNVKCAFAIK